LFCNILSYLGGRNLIIVCKQRPELGTAQPQLLIVSIKAVFMISWVAWRQTSFVYLKQIQYLLFYLIFLGGGRVENKFSENSFWFY
jgi:hypothetical protein